MPNEAEGFDPTSGRHHGATGWPLSPTDGLQGCARGHTSVAQVIEILGRTPEGVSERMLNFLN